jgi:hypothetical protein
MCTLACDNDGMLNPTTCSCDCSPRFSGRDCKEAVPCSDELYKKVEGTCGDGFSVNTDSCLCEKAEKIVVGTDVPANTLAGIIVGSVTGTIILTVAVVVVIVFWSSGKA